MLNVKAKLSSVVISIALFSVFILLVILSITTTHTSRLELNKLNKLRTEEQKLYLEYNKLLLEQHTFYSYDKVEAIAIDQLNMRSLYPNEVQIINID